ncbi:MAG: ROK family protein, partial [Candidatus Zixiibacteriota bacterium]
KSQGDSLLSNMAKVDSQSITPRAISEAARKGDALSLEVLRETGEIIGAALSSVVNLLNLPLIIIGGGIAQAGDLLFKPIEESIRKRALPIPRKRVKVVSTKLGEWAGVIGAAALAMKEMQDFLK